MIRLTIQRKVFLATFVLVTSMAVLLLLFTRWNLGQGFERYAAAAEISRLDWIVANAEREYAAEGSWDFLRQNPRESWHRIQSRNSPQGNNALPPRWAGGPPPWGPPPGMEGQPMPPGQQGWQGPPPQQNQGAWQDRPPPPGPQSWQGAPSQQGQAPGPDAGPPGQQAWQPPQTAQPGPVAEQSPPPGNAQPTRTRGGAPGDLLSIGPRLALLDADGKVLAGNAKATEARAQRPIRYETEVVGRIALLPAPSTSTEQGAAFLASQTHSLLLAGLAALSLSFFAALWLARHFLAPIRKLAAGARRIADHHLDTRIDVQRSDELGELADDFNSMAEQLTRAEESRRAWISDTSHELRTPLAVLRAEIEALQDGVRTADAATFDRLLRQVHQLTKLVDDLRQTMDRDPEGTALNFNRLKPVTLVKELALAFQERYREAGIALDTSLLTEKGWTIRGDEERLTQVFSNLLENTLRYTNRDGLLRIAAQTAGGKLILQFDDTAPAPPQEALPRLFERFFRAEASRSRNFGGSGLGLAICKTMIEAHDGIITAALSQLGGLCIRIELPLDNQS